jgi:hypothetical protein
MQALELLRFKGSLIPADARSEKSLTQAISDGIDDLETFGRPGMLIDKLFAGVLRVLTPLGARYISAFMGAADLPAVDFPSLQSAAAAGVDAPPTPGDRRLVR